MAWHPPSEVGDVAPEISEAKEALDNYTYGAGLKVEKLGSGQYNDTYTEAFGAALLAYGPKVNEDIRRGRRKPPFITPEGCKGVFDWSVKNQLGLLHLAPVVDTSWRPIFLFSAPGSGANNMVGPSNDIGVECQNRLRINHRRLEFPIGGYLGLMGGDPGLSYIEVITKEGENLDLQVAAAIEETKRQVGDNWANVIEFWFSGYSQSADGMAKAVARLFGDGGKYSMLRDRINGLILFGNPARQPGLCRIGSNPKVFMDAPGWGISRDILPQWLNNITYSITTVGDMYACTEDNTLLPGFYDWFIQAETSLGFVGYSVALLLPVLTSYLNIAGPLVGGIFGDVGAQIIASSAGVALPFLSQAIGAVQAPGTVGPDPEFIKQLSAGGILSLGGISRVFNTLRALPGIQTHGLYWDPRPEFGGRRGIDVGYDIVAGFRR
jgi:hypothetical protein